MNSDYFKNNIEGVSLVQKAIKELDIKVDSATTVQQLFAYNNSILAFIVDELRKELK
ncbi:MAG: hypothetical protein HGA27_00405 [Peptococcaceae bacterium]|nr:hypothetical protein [Peptococcaceae bacterium]